MIFRRSLVRELTLTVSGLFLILVGILFTNLVLRLLARAAGGTIQPDSVLPLLGFSSMLYLPVLLAVALFLTVLMTITRWYRDSEMIVWYTSGQSLASFLKPILWFAAPFLVAIVVLALFLQPWAEQRKAEFERQLESREDLAVLSPGLFREFKRANIVVFIESINTFDGTIHNVFLHSIDRQKDETTVARSARLQEGKDGERFVVLSDGRRYEGNPGTADFRIIEFGSLSRRIEPNEARALPATRKAVPTAALLVADGSLERAELFWRISVPIMGLVLTLLAIPLGQVNPRAGRSFNLVTAILVYMLYSNSLNIVQSLIGQGRLNFWVGLALPHALALVIAFALFRSRMAVPGLRRFRRKDPAA